MNQSVQIDNVLEDRSIQNDGAPMGVDCSIQKYGPSGEDISIQPTLRYQDVSISMSRKEQSFGVQGGVSVKEQSNQFSIVELEDEEVQIEPDAVD